eukprot:CAMPEP_0196147344 /NCGR_PEP_ID=MMETSP0910-20130528/25203_1 /TAXON_ID=49265 /ORGANISM="Thalassiosira rotula, Strain GSO102" /LENGTH=1458 /DNA_ID=CAMNT_0041409743 /DNA_START=91 /DNA_END=4467 /DNA_ORIENTATION=-
MSIALVRALLVLSAHHSSRARAFTTVHGNKLHETPSRRRRSANDAAIRKTSPPRRAGIIDNEMRLTTERSVIIATKMTTASNTNPDPDVDHRRRSRGIPKEETGIYDLYDEYPKSDGSGVKICIMDTGCDLNAAGLNGTTSDGITPKYIDFLDCTGDGDVVMNETVVPFDYATSNKTVEGLSGRNITVGEWAENVGALKLGAVRLYELLPYGVRKRLKRERKEAFMVKHRALISETQKTLDGLNGLNDAPPSEKSDADGDDAKKEAAKKVESEKKELKLLLEQLKAIMDSYEDYGPLMDLIMFKDMGEAEKDNGDDGDDGVWKAVIDLEADGNLVDATPMAPFGHARQIGELAFGSAVTFCIQVYDDGNILNIVTDAGSHGTHVAGIAAANFDSDDDDGSSDDLNGAAPGAQILACKIGDGRLDSTETGTGLIRALIAAKRHGCDVVNLSYGESSWQPNSGRVSRVFADAVRDWGMTVFTSAGNDGPALSSLGCPGSLTAPVTVGAYVSPAMSVEQYSTLPPVGGDDEVVVPLRGASYYFSSRGPTPDGMLPDVCAPGGAIAPIPRHSLQGKAQYHGTSMSSPNACGVAACILSAVRGKGVNCGPVELKRGLMNSAVRAVEVDGVDDPFAQGAGLVSARDCAEYIISNHGKRGQNLAIDVSIPARNQARGIYIRDEVELEGPMTFGVQVKPRFSHSNQRTSSEMDELLSLELDLQLKASEDWVACPDSMRLMSATERNGQTFSVRLNTDGMTPGVHFATVDAIDASDPDRGNLFSLPITVIVPHTKFVSKDEPTLKLNDNEHVILKGNGLDIATTYELVQGVPNRRFLTVPRGAEYATIKLRGRKLGTSTSPRVLVHAIPFVGGDMPNSECQLKRLYAMKDGVEEEYHVRVKDGSTLELCLQLLWLANPCPASIEADIEFHSLDIRSSTLISSQPITITAAKEFARLGASTPLRSEKLNASCSLKSVRRTLRPQSSAIKLGLADLDVQPPSDAEVRSSDSQQSATALGTQIYEMRLGYKFSIEGDKEIKARPSIPSLFAQIYDSPVDSQLWALEDSNSQILAYGGAIHHADPVSLKKGDYTVTLLIRHPNRDVLETMKNTPCEISLTLPDALTCNLYDELDKASTPGLKDDGRSPLGSILLHKGSHKDIYVSRPMEDLPAWVAPGDILVGSLVLDKDKEGVTSMDVLYVAPPKPKKEDSEKEKSDSEEKPDSLEDVVFKAKLDHMAKLRAKNATLYQEHATELKKERPSSVPLLSELLSFALESPVPSTELSEEKWRAKEVELVYNAMQNTNDGPINATTLAQYFGLNEPDKDELEADDEAKKLNKEMKEQRKLLRKTLLSRAALAGDIADKDLSAEAGLSEAVTELKKWVSAACLENDKEKVKLAIILARHARICQRKKATAVSILLKAKKDLSGKDLKQVDEELIKVYGLFDGMGHVGDNLKEGILAHFPVLKRGV